MIDPIKFLRPNIARLAPYSTARDEYDGPLGIYLDANENPYDNGVNRYPDPRQRTLKDKISAIKGIPSENIFIGNGSDEPIDLAFRIFCEPGKHNAVSIAPTYGMYKVAAAINNVEMREVSLEEDFSLDSSKLLAATDSNTRLMFICSPNNPTGNSFPATTIKYLLENFEGVVVLDEAYIDFSQQESMLNEIFDYPNLIILQTLSKAWGMAGLRLGMAFAREDIIKVLSNVKYPYNINVITQQAVFEKLDQDISLQVEEIIGQRSYITTEFDSCDLVKKYYPTDANFILVKVDRPREVYDALIECGIIVRDRSHIKGCENCLRITIGTPDENRKMLEVIRGMSKNNE